MTTASDERLNMLIDGELTPADAAGLLEQLRTDAALRERVSQLRLAKDLVRHAYAGVAAPARQATAPVRGRRRAVVTFAALGLGVVLGWTLREQAAAPAGATRQLAEQAQRTPQAETSRVILHVSSGVPGDALAALERAEGILETARSAGRTVSVEIVANSGGLDLLREGVSTHAGRIAGLRAAYPGLSLVACGQTAQRLREGGTAVHLLPGTVTASSALDQIVLRMQQGWAYVRI
ncbi:MAG: hypothetical protein IH627_18205 [Rubrivivax sp.]|nr:hypothetical protein [Rubrivivax sp.]